MVLCTIFNSKKFKEKFIESQKGRGAYVDALSKSAPYVFEFPNKMDFIEVKYNPKEPGEEDYDPDQVVSDRVYSYVYKVYKEDDNQFLGYQWTATGQRDFLRATSDAQARDVKDRKLRDETVSRFLNLLSERSRVLLNNTAGFKEAVRVNDIWLIVCQYLDESHNQVSASAVQKRTREFVSCTQDTPLATFTDTFVKSSEQFISDWEDVNFPGYLKMDALLAHTFVEAVRGGVEIDLLKPALEALSLTSGPHRNASLSLAIESVTSYYMRNKPTESIEQSVAFKAASLPVAGKCDCCHVQDAVADIKTLHSLLTSQNSRLFNRFVGSTGVPVYCASCIQNPPRCSCGKERSAPCHSVCLECFRKSRPPKEKRVPKSDAKANIAKSEPPTPPPASVSAVPHGQSWQYPPPPPPMHYGMMAHYGHPGSHPSMPYGYSPPPPPASRDEDSVSEYSASSQQGHQPFFGTAPFSLSLLDITSASCELFDLLKESQALMATSVYNGARDSERSEYHADSCASLNCTDVLAHLDNQRALPHPIPINGIGDKPCFLTHVGDLPWMPRGMRQCFYGKDFGAKLISLNYMCLHGRTQYYNVPKHRSTVVLVDDVHFATCSISRNNLLSLPAKGRGTFYPFPGQLSQHTALVSAAEVSVSADGSETVVPLSQASAVASAPVTIPSTTSLGPGTFGPPLDVRAYTKEQIRRCDMVEYLLDFFCRPPDDVLAHSLTVGAVGEFSTHLTPTDVHLNRTLRGPDWFRIQGRLRSPPVGPSRSLPSPAPCFALVIDQHHSKFPDIFGNTCTIHISCENSGGFWVESAKSGKAAHLYAAMTKFIHTECNAYGHRVHTLHADADSVFNKMVAPFGAVGVRVMLAPPGHHAVRVERHTQTFNERRRMLEASLAFTIPEKFGLATFMDKHVAYAMRNLVSSAGGYLNTADEIVKRTRNPITPQKCCPFYAVVAVRMGEVKRAALAAKLMVHIQRIPFSEMAICLGSSDGATRDAHYFFVYSTMKVVLRRNFKLLGGIIPDFCTPKSRDIYRLDPSARMTAPVYPSTSDQLQLVQQGVDCMKPVSIDARGVNLDLVEDVPVTAVGPTRHSVSMLSPPSSPVVLPTPVLSPAVDMPSLPVHAGPPHDTQLRHADVSPAYKVVDSAPTLVPVVAPVEVAPPVIVPPVHVRPVIEDTLSHVTVMHSPPVVASPKMSPPARRASTREGRGVNRHLHFDNSPATSQHQRKVALIAARVRANHTMSAATWADICSASGSIAPPPAVVARAFVSVPVLPAGSPRRAAFVAGSRRTPVRSSVSAKPSFIRPLLRHLCFLSVMQNAMLGMSLLDLSSAMECPDLSAFVSSPLLDVDAVPTPPLSFSAKDNKEMSYRQGVKSMPPEEVRAAVKKEIDKLFTTHLALRAIKSADIRSDAVYIYSSMLLKTKYFADGTYDRVAARLAANGKDQPEGSFGETYAPTADESSTLCAFSSFSAHSVQHGYADDISCSNFDVKGAFLWVARPNKTQIIMRLPSYIDHPLAGQNVEVLKSIYGLKDSNANFDADLRKTIVSAGFRGTVDPCIYIKMAPNPANPAAPFRCLVSTHVDDGRAMYNHRPFYNDLITTLEKRYGPLSKDDNTTSYTGTTFAQESGGFKITQEGYVARLLASINLINLAIRSTPSDDDLFGDTSGTPLCNPKTYRQLVGSLIHLLRTRYDIQKEVVHLSGKMSLPTEGDMAKGIKVLQYLKGTPSLGPRYHTAEGPILYVYVDASYAVHFDGRSQTGCSFHIGKDSAPFYVKAGKQTECVSIGSMEAEYVALSQAARKLLEFRYLMEDIGFPQIAPTVIYEDNMSAINLAVAPHITRKSRHIHTRHHFIRDLVAQKLAVVKHLATEDMLADFFTKPYGPKRFRAARDRLFNNRC